MLKEGEKAPDFKLEGSDGKEHSLGEFRGKKIVLYFYPKDDTPGCTIEACGFRDTNSKIKKKGAVVIGISKDERVSHLKFKKKYRLNFLLLSDPTNRTIKKYGSYGDRGIFGMGTIRNTFIIDERGRIARIFRKVHPEGHNEEILAALEKKSGDETEYITKKLRSLGYM